MKVLTTCIGLLLVVTSFTRVRSQDPSDWFSDDDSDDSDDSEDSSDYDDSDETIDGRGEEDARRFMARLSKEMDKRMNKNMLASWAYETNVGNETLNNQIAVEAESARFIRKRWLEAKQFRWRTFTDARLKRQFFMFSIIGEEALTEKKYKEYKQIIGEMTDLYSQAKVCSYQNRTNCDVKLDPDIMKIMAASRDPDELKYYWIEWHNAIGKGIRPLFPRYVRLFREAAALNNLKDPAKLWLWEYEDEYFTTYVAKLWEQMKPLYLQVHAFVRRKLREKYGEKVVPRGKPIPSHLLGNVWAHQWFSIADLTYPFNMKAIDITPEMVKKGYTVEKIFKVAEDFYTSIDLSPMPDSFWKLSMLEKPKDRKVICEAAAKDFYDGKDYRMRQCTTVTYENLRMAHREMGLLEYFLQYKHQPYFFKKGANPGFREAIGDTIVFSVQTANHLQGLGLINGTTVPDADTELLSLLVTGLRKIILIPYAYMMDMWRWGVFRGEITEDQYNHAWWKLRTELQGLEPPEFRSEEFFDPGVKYQIAAGKEYLRYFVSFVIQFQFHRSLCEAAGNIIQTIRMKSLYIGVIFVKTKMQATC
ncbi:unnamed protein product [Bemisia tabaci]|uniref:Angiotensin-converting enzyme n=1 Tax=Bemisia tabaci TaxID=7038 RepID=A0A9P0F2F9_BEMTA|nr:unnamed protein product [Bemisia tabaci]